jgi:tRNA A37 N6-isopentenylltransferase MiaA
LRANAGLKDGISLGSCKRQLTWFRRQLAPKWIGLKPDESLEKCAQIICETI